MSTLSTSVIVPVWNGRDVLPACLEALAKQAMPPDQIILIDDASSDDALDWALERYPSLTVRRHERSVGFVHSVNEGLELAEGDLLVLLNQDTIVEPDWLRALAAASQMPDVAIVGSRVLNADGTLQHCGGAVDMRGDTTHRVHAHLSERAEPQETEWVTGASLAITRAALQAIGPLDDRFAPAYYEDVEWCVRARAEGFSVLYVPASGVIHLEESRLRSENAAFMRLYHGNRLRLVLKHWSLEALEEAFLPAEQAWLEQLGPGGERLIIVMKQLYLDHLMTLGQIDEWRRSQEDERPASDVIAPILTHLYGVMPLILPPMQTVRRPSTPALDGEYETKLGEASLSSLPSEVIDAADQPQAALPEVRRNLPPPSAALAPQPAPPPPAPPEEPVPPPHTALPGEPWRKRVDEQLRPLVAAILKPLMEAQRRQIDHELLKQHRHLSHSDALLRHELTHAMTLLRHELRHADAQERHKTLEMLAIYHQRIRRAAADQHQALAKAVVAQHSSFDTALSDHHSAVLDALRTHHDTLVDAANHALGDAFDAWEHALNQALAAHRDQNNQTTELLLTYLREQASTTAALAQRVAELEARLSARDDGSPGDDPSTG